MHVVLAISIAVLLLATTSSLALLRRIDEPRVLLLATPLALLATAQGLALWSFGGRPLGLDLPTLAALLALGASLLCPLLVRALGRTLRERERSEALHWRSMEGVRALADLSALPALGLEARIKRLLAIGCAQLDLKLGLFARALDEGFEVVAIRGARDAAVDRGTLFPADATWCRMTLDSARPFDVPDISASAWADGLRSEELAFECYLGSVVRAGGERIGILGFAGFEQRLERFSATEKDLLTLMARWLGRELEQEQAATQAAAALQQTIAERDAALRRGQLEQEREAIEREREAMLEGEPAAPAPPRRQLGPGWRQVRIPPPRRSQPSSRMQPGAPQEPPPSAQEPAVTRRRPASRRRPAWRRRGERAAPRSLNRFLRRIEPRLQRAAGIGPVLDLRLHAELDPAPLPRVPLDAVVLSLVSTAAQALGGEGRVEVATADLEVPVPAPGVLPAVPPDRYATIEVRAVGAGVDPDRIASAFEPSRDEAPFAADRTRLSLSTLYHLLQRAGGDLAVEVERGCSARFTVFLPRAQTTSVGRAGADLASPPLS